MCRRGRSLRPRRLGTRPDPGRIEHQDPPPLLDGIRVPSPGPRRIVFPLRQTRRLPMRSSVGGRRASGIGRRAGRWRGCAGSPRSNLAGVARCRRGRLDGAPAVRFRVSAYSPG
jgi:hypothetical protein